MLEKEVTDLIMGAAMGWRGVKQEGEYMKNRLLYFQN